MGKRQPRVGGAALVAVLLLPSLPAWCQSASSVKNVVEACGQMDADLAQVIESEVALVDVGAVSRNADGTYRITTQPYTVGAGSVPLCSDSRFYGQPTIDGLPFRSAVQVGPDLVLTAWHNSTNGATPELYALFGLRYRLVGDNCVPPDLEHVPDADVYSVTEVAADGLNPTAGTPRDFLLLRLDRNVSSTYPRVRRRGQGTADADHHDRMSLISHPDRLAAAKVDLGGRLVGYSDPTYTGPQVANIHPLQWSSGGMVYNRDARLVETVVRSGVAAWYSRDPSGCYRVAETAGFNATNDSLADFAQNIPAAELLVTPLATVVHDAPIGGPLSHAVTTRTIDAPATARNAIDYRITLPATTAGGPELQVTVRGSLAGRLGPGSGIDVEEIVNADGVACGEYERTYSVTDETHGYSDVVRHRFEIGLREFTVDPPFGSGITDVAAPFAGRVSTTGLPLLPRLVSRSQGWLAVTVTV